jgi:hypothetical protein
MDSLHTASSLAIVDRDDPRTSKCCLTKFLVRSPSLLTTEGMGFRFLDLIPGETAYFRGIVIRIRTSSGHPAPDLHLGLLPLCQLPQHLSPMLPPSPVQHLAPTLRKKPLWHLRSHFVGLERLLQLAFPVRSLPNLMRGHDTESTAYG